MNRTFVIADTHFGDPKIIEYENRPFNTVDEMDKILIGNWNHVVRSQHDIVFVLGDFSVYDVGKTKEIVQRLNGLKILIKGNHDNITSNSVYQGMGFESVVDYPVIYDNFFILSHEPMYINSNMPYANIFGHVHSNPSFKDVSAQSACVCVERISYAPIRIDSIYNKMKLEQDLLKVKE